MFGIVAEVCRDVHEPNTQPAGYGLNLLLETPVSCDCTAELVTVHYYQYKYMRSWLT